MARFQAITEASTMVVSLRHPESIDRLSFKIEFHQHCGLVSYHPPVVPRLDGDDLRSHKLQNASICVLNMDLAPGKEAHMGVHAKFTADDGFHIDRPAEPGRIDNTLNATRASSHNIELDAGDVAVVALSERV
jgi:hypothetical protein